MPSPLEGYFSAHLDANAASLQAVFKKKGDIKQAFEALPKDTQEKIKSYLPKGTGWKEFEKRPFSEKILFVNFVPVLLWMEDLQACLGKEDENDQTWDLLLQSSPHAEFGAHLIQQIREKSEALVAQKESKKRKQMKALVKEEKAVVEGYLKLTDADLKPLLKGLTKDDDAKKHGAIQNLIDRFPHFLGNPLEKAEDSSSMASAIISFGEREVGALHSFIHSTLGGHLEQLKQSYEGTQTASQAQKVDSQPQVSSKDLESSSDEEVVVTKTSTPKKSKAKSAKRVQSHRSLMKRSLRSCGRRQRLIRIASNFSETL